MYIKQKKAPNKQKGCNRFPSGTSVPSALVTRKTSLHSWMPVVSGSDPPLQENPDSGSSSCPSQSSLSSRSEIQGQIKDKSICSFQFLQVVSLLNVQHDYIMSSWPLYYQPSFLEEPHIFICPGDMTRNPRHQGASRTQQSWSM